MSSDKLKLFIRLILSNYSSNKETPSLYLKTLVLKTFYRLTLSFGHFSVNPWTCFKKDTNFKKITKYYFNKILIKHMIYNYSYSYKL
jgi:hypothetical protein